MKLQPSTIKMTGNRERTQITVRKTRPVRPDNFKPYTDLNASTIKVVKRRRVRDDLPAPAPKAATAEVQEEPEPGKVQAPAAWPHPPLTDAQRKPTSRKRVIEQQYAHLKKGKRRDV